MLLEYRNDPLFEIRKYLKSRTMECSSEDTLGQRNVDDDINEILVSDQYDEEDVNEENCESNEE